MLEDKKLKIVLLIDSLTSGGKERRFVELLKGLKNCKDISCEVVILSNEVHYKEIYNLNFPIHFLPRNLKKDIRIFQQLYFICKKFAPDIIHSWESMCTVYALPTAKILRIKLINAMIADAPDKLKVFSKLWFRAKVTFPFSDIVLSNSLAGLKAYNVPKKQGHHIHNGIDMRRMKIAHETEKIRKKFHIQSKIVIGMVGAFSPRKDYYTFIKAAKVLISKNYDITFMAVGDGPDLKRCKSLVNEQENKKILFTGLQSDIESLVNLFDIGVLTTNQNVHGEGISNAIMEYMALGKPVVATKGGGTNELVIHAKTGFLIKNKDTEALVKNIELLIEDAALRKQMGEDGKQQIITNFSLNRMTENYIKLYHSLSKNKLELAEKTKQAKHCEKSII